MRVFVYGSLMRNEYAAWRMRGCDFVADAETTDGFSLVDLGDYPGLIRSGSSRVVGEIWEVPPEVLHRLDAYEGHPDLYLRQEIALADGSRVHAWIYLEDDGPGRPVPSGNWRLHRADRQETI